MHIDNKGKDILIFCQGQTQGLQGTALTAEAKCLISFTQLRKRFIYSLNYHGSNSFLFVNNTKMYHFKAKKTQK